MLIDTHAHLYLENFRQDIDEVLVRAENLNVKKIFLPNIDMTTVDDLHNLCERFPDFCFPMMGVHPCSIKNDTYKQELREGEAHLKEKKYYGIGETGIDLYWDKSTERIQIFAFEEQINWALTYDIPVIIHSRDALDLTIDIISNNQNGHLKGIFHCFNGTIEQCKQIMNLNFMMGLGGVVTYKNAKLDDVIKYMPLKNMLLETDAPYLSPVPHRGKRNESSYICEVAEKIANVKNVSVNEINEITTTNAVNLF